MTFSLPTLFLLLSGLACLKAQSFQNLTTSVTINETMNPGRNTRVFDVRSTSSNSGSFPYSVICVPSSSIPSNTCDVFELVATDVTAFSWSGYVSLKRALNSLSVSAYTIFLRAADAAGQSTTASVTINVNTNRLRPPVFVGNPDVEIPQRPTASQVEIIQYNARDPTPGGRNVNYRILNGTFKDYFILDPVLGRLTNSRPLQYSDPNLADGPPKIRVEAAYVVGSSPAWSNPALSTTIESTIFLIDQNLNRPTFDKAAYAGAIQETAPANTFVNSIFFVVEDKDRSQTSASFALTLDKYNDIFQVQPASGYNRLEARLSIKTNQFFNFNTGPRWYSFNVIVEETLSSQKSSSSASVNVTLIQVNRFAPQFMQNPYFATVAENAVSGTPVVQVQAWDMDVGSFGNKSIRYRFSNAASENFKMDTLTGLITVGKCRQPGVSPCLDYETTKESPRLLVWAADILGEGKTGTTTVVVNITNVNDNQPVFTAVNYYATIDDGTTDLSPLSPPGLATDEDNDRLTYRINSGNPRNSWSIDPNTGVITATRPITYSNAQVNGTYELVISVTDGTFQSLATVTITVKPVNRYPPVFQRSLYNVSIVETQPADKAFIKVLATDQDHPSTDGGKVLYRILSGSMGKFQINSNTGEVSVSPGGSLNHREKPFYNMTIQAYDLGAPQRQSESILLVYLEPKRPFVDLPNVTQYITDSLTVNTIVVVLSPTSSQLGSNPTFTFSTYQQPQLFDRNLNRIPNPTSDQENMFRVGSDGTVQVNRPLNADQVRRWQQMVQVNTVPANSTLTDTGLLTIWISSANKVPPRFDYPWTPQSPFYNMTVKQGANFQPIAGFFTATPANTSLSITYSLVDPFNFFQLQSPNSGIIKQIQPINQANNNYKLTLTATDNGQPPLSSRAIINVIVDSVNMEAPTFSRDRYSANIFDDVAPGTEVVTVAATDPDKGDFGVVRYSIVSPRDRFQINPLTGVITVKKSDFNSPTEPHILLEVKATDSQSDPSKQKLSIAYANVTVLDANNNAPVFQPANYDTIIYSNLPVNSEAIKVTATDADQGANARITYRITAGNDEDYFRVDPNTGSIRLLKELPLSEKEFDLVISASDAGSPPKTTTSRVHVLVKVRCVDNCDPVWVRPDEYLSRTSVVENRPVASTIYRLEATPYQAQNTLDFSFARDGDVNNLVKELEDFKIVQDNSHSANIQVASPLNYNTKNRYELLTVVRDTSIPNSEKLRYMVVNVIPVKTFNPRFPFNDNNYCSLPVLIRVPQGSPANVPLAEVKATANHLFDTVRYNIEDPDKVPFKVDDKGQLSASSILNTATAYSFKIKADYANNSQNIEQTQELCTIDNNDQSAVITTVEVYKLFINDTLVVCFKEDSDPGSVVAELNNFLQYPTDKQHVTYNPVTMKGFQVKKNGEVLLQNLQAAIDNVCTLNQRNCEIPVQVTRSVLNSKASTTIRLRPVRIANNQALTLITLNTTLANFNDGPGKARLLRNLANKTENGYQCIVDAGFHTVQSGSFDQRLTDVYLYTMDGFYQPIQPLVLDDMLRAVRDRDSAAIVGITDADSRWGGFNWEPVAIAMGLIIGLLILACLFFLCFCCWGFLSQWCIQKYAAEKEPIIAGNSGLVNRAWSSHPVLDEQPEPYPFEPEITDMEATESYARKDDLTTVDGAASSVVGPQGPTGYVYIEAPLSRSASAFGTVDEVDASATGRTVETVTETFVRSGYDGDNNAYGGQGHNNLYHNHKESTKARAFSSKSGGLDDIDEGEAHQPVQLNQASSTGGPSQIGAILIRPETPGGQGYTQRAVGGEGEAISHFNYDTTYSNNDPSRLNMALQNEVMMNSTAGRTSYYDESMANVRGYPAEVPMEQYANNVGAARQEQTFMEQFEETRYL